MNKRNLVLLLISTILIVSTATLLFYSHYLVREVRYIDAYVTVGDKLGINTDKDALRFGIIPEGNRGFRYVNVTHSFDVPVKVRITQYGDLRQWLYVEPNEFVLDPRDSRKITFIATVPEGTPNGNYTGRVKIMFYRII